MQIELKINGELADLQEVLKALLITQTASEATTPQEMEVRKMLSQGGKAAAAKAPVKAKEAPAAAPTPNPEPQQPEAPAPEVINPSTEATVTYEQVRAAMGEVAIRDKKAAKDILTRYGASRTPEVKPEDYAAIMEELKAIK